MNLPLMVFLMIKLICFIARGSDTRMIFGMANIAPSFHGTRHKKKINLTQMDVEDKITVTTTILNQWQHLLEDDMEVTHLDQWVGPYVD